ncbi:MAG TPA: hypothetical protein VFP14_07420 [Novosphingobium sp.]|nr:hypothetical protein [Novosphingobium sp.]
MRGRIEIALALAAGLPLVFGAAVATRPGVAGPHVARVMAAVASPLAILDSRSPGARRPGVVQTKFAAAKPRPTERVLSEVRERPAPAGAPAAPGLSPAALNSLPVLGPNGAPGQLIPLPAVGPVGGGSPPLLVPLTPVLDIPPVNPPLPPTPPPAVPEPVTWATLLTGMAVVAAQLRRERRRKTHLAPSTAA